MPNLLYFQRTSLKCPGSLSIFGSYPYNYPALLRLWKEVPLFQPFAKHSTRNLMREKCATGISTSDRLRTTFLTTRNLKQLLATSCPWFSVDTNLHAAKWNLRPDLCQPARGTFFGPSQGKWPKLPNFAQHQQAFNRPEPELLSPAPLQFAFSIRPFSRRPNPPYKHSFFSGR